MAEGDAGVRASVGFFSDKGPRKENEDFAAAVIGAELPEPRREVVAAIADGVGGAKGGRVAAELAVRGFLDGFWDLPETMEVRRAGARVISALNAWINALGRQDPKLKGMACTFTALVLRGRVAHLLHIGDTRAYRLRRDRLACLTEDHSRDGGPGNSRVLTRALGAEREARLDYASQPVALHDRFLLCSDGVHGVMTDDSIAELLRERSAPDDTAKALVAAALDADMVPMGSAGAKAMAVVLGDADVYAHAGGQYEWDSAAPVAVAVAGSSGGATPTGTGGSSRAS